MIMSFRINFSAAFLLIAIQGFSQSNGGFSYQAVARDADGQPVANRQISVLFSILDGTDPEDKLLLYQESQQVMSNDYGLFSAEVGMGNTVLGDFATIDWSVPGLYLQVHIDLSGNQGFTLMGSSKILPIPIAYYAIRAGNTSEDLDTDTTNELQMLSYDQNTHVISLTDGGSIDISGLIDTFESPWMVTDDYIVYLDGRVKADSLFGYLDNQSLYEFDNRGFTIRNPSGIGFLFRLAKFKNSADNWGLNLYASGKNVVTLASQGDAGLLRLSQREKEGIELTAEISDSSSRRIAIMDSTLLPAFEVKLDADDRRILNLYNGTLNLNSGKGYDYLTAFGTDSTAGAILTRGLNGKLNSFIGRGLLDPNQGGILLLDSLEYYKVILSSTQQGGYFALANDNETGLTALADERSGYFNLILNNGNFTILEEDFEKVKLWNEDNAGRFSLYSSVNNPFFELYATGNGTNRDNGQLKLYNNSGDAGFEILSASNGATMKVKNTTSDAGLYVDQVIGDRMRVSINDGDFLTRNGRISLHQGNEQRMAMAANAVETNLTLWRNNGVKLLSLGTNEVFPGLSNMIFYRNGTNIGTWLGSSQQGGFLGIYDASNNRSIELFSNEDNSGEQEFFNHDNNKIVSLGDGLFAGGEVIIYDDDENEEAGMYVSPTGESTVFADVKSFKVEHPEDSNKDIWYASIEGPEAAIYDRGNAQLIDGSVFVPFPETFKLLVDFESLTIQLTPQSAESKGLAVVEKNNQGFLVKELFNGTGSYAFYWEIKANRSAFKDFQVIRPKKSRQ